MAKLDVYGYIINGVKHDIPFIEMIQSVLPFADAVHIVTDPRFNDGTIQKLEMVFGNHAQVHIHETGMDLNNPGIDGATKQFARSKCEAGLLMQMDADEVVREEDAKKIAELKTIWPNNVTVIGTGVVNWFNGEHVKLNAAGATKERFTRGDAIIYHGIPVQLRIPIVNTDYFSAQPETTDGAGLINDIGNPVLPQLLLAKGDNPVRDIDNPDSIWIHHYSWYSLPRKWEMKSTWHYFWGLLFGKYTGLKDYTKDLDGDPVDFWSRGITRPPHTYIQPIKDEMKEKSIVKAGNISHPAIMKDWIARQRVYYSRPWPFKDIAINMESQIFSFSGTDNGNNN